MITNTVSVVLGQLAEELGISRSEVLEWMIRGGGLDAAKHYRAKQKIVASYKCNSIC